MISLKKISKNFGGVKALSNINTQLETGKTTLLIGGNASGKSTLAKILAGDIAPTSGKIIFEERAYGKLTPKRAKKLGIAVVYQDLSVDDNRNVYENIFMGQEICFPLGILNKAAMKKEALALYNKVGLQPPKLTTKVKFLSGGQRQVIAILRGLKRKAKFLILDEPTASLGVFETQQVEEIIKELKKLNLTMLIISHDTKQIAELADAVIELDHGRIMAL